MSHWTREASLRLVELYHEGRSAAVIAVLLCREGFINVSRNAIIGRCHRLQLPARPKKPITRRRVRNTAQETEKRRERRRREQEREQLMDRDTRNKLRCEDVTPLLISIHELTSNTCRYPYGDHPPFRYCGLPIAHRSYCLVHAAKCFGGP